MEAWKTKPPIDIDVVSYDDDAVGPLPLPALHTRGKKSMASVTTSNPSTALSGHLSTLLRESAPILTYILTCAAPILTQGATCEGDNPTCNIRAAVTLVGTRLGTIRYEA
jgi:hypothetical protein